MSTTPHDLGASVRQVVKPIEGHVSNIQWDIEQKKFKYLVEFDDGAATPGPGERWFWHDEIEANPNGTSAAPSGNDTQEG